MRNLILLYNKNVIMANFFNNVWKACNKNVSTRFFTLMLIWLACLSAVALPLIRIDFSFDELRLLKLFGYCVLTTPLLSFGLGSLLDGGDYVLKKYEVRFGVFGILLLDAVIGLLVIIIMTFNLMGVAAAILWNIFMMPHFIKLFINVMEN